MVTLAFLLPLLCFSWWWLGVGIGPDDGIVSKSLLLEASIELETSLKLLLMIFPEDGLQEP